MHYFAHTLKGCGSLALAFVLTACGEETTGSLAVTSVEDTGTARLATQPIERPPLSQKIVATQPLVTLIAKTDNNLNSNATQLVWNADNVDSCTASGAWEGELGANGELVVQPGAAGDLTYIIMCDGASGSAMAIVTV